MRIGLPIARIAGVEVRISVPWLLLVALAMIIGAEQAAATSPSIGTVAHWSIGALVAFLFSATSVAHELAHGLVARRVGVEVRGVTVGFASGGAGPIPAARPGDDLLIALSGPIVSIAASVACVPLAIGAILAGGTGGGSGALAGGLIVVAGLNMAMGLLSLVPAPPLDGARVVRAIAWARSGDLRSGSRASVRVGRITGYGAFGLGVLMAVLGESTAGLMALMLGWLLLRDAAGLSRRLDVEGMLAGVAVREAIRSDVPQIPPGLTVDTFADRFAEEGAASTFPVVDGGRVLGVISQRRLQRLGRGKLAELRAADVLAAPPEAPFLDPNGRLWDAVELLGAQGLDGLAVLDGETLLGVVTRDSVGSLLRARGAMGEPG